MEPRLPVTPLKQHHGRHGGLVALGLLATTTVVVWTTRTRRTDPVVTIAPRPPLAAASMPAEPPAPPPAIELGPTSETAIVAERELRWVVAATGTVTYDERRTAHVRVPVAGWLVKTRATSLGRVVRAGETLGVIYSPEVYLATQDVIAEMRDFKGQEPLDRARLRLLRWGMRRDQLARIEQTLKPEAALPLVARVTGTVVAEQGAAKQLIDPSAGELFTITDPTYAWAYVSIPTSEAALLGLGMTARVTIGGARPLPAPITYISRRADDGMKTVRVDLHAAGLRMPAAGDAQVELARTTARGPAIPETAVRRDGERAFVYVVRGTTAELRAVKLGPAVDGFVLVMHGLAAGDTVVLPREPR